MIKGSSFPEHSLCQAMRRLVSRGAPTWREARYEARQNRVAHPDADLDGDLT